MAIQEGTRIVEPHLAMLPQVQLKRVLHSWPQHSRDVAEHLIHDYQVPQIVTRFFLLWEYNSPWKKTVVYRQGVPHHFPSAHLDVVEQTVDYRVPIEACQKLMEFNSSLMINRTRGELTAWCNTESMNCVILNLANDIISGRKTVEEARDKQHAIAMALRFNWPAEYAQGLHFNPSAQEEETYVYHSP